MIQQIVDVDAENALNGTTVMHTIAVQKGASILRVHDVRSRASFSTCELFKPTGIDSNNLSL